MITLTEFHQDFLQTVLSESDSRGLMRSHTFFEITCETLVEIGDLTENYTAADYSKVGMEAHGYDYDEQRRILSVLIHQFFQEDHIETLTKTLINTKFNRLKSFIKKSIRGLYKDMEETSDAYSMSYNIYKYLQKKEVNKIRLIVLTDGKMTRTLNELDSEEIDGIPVDFRIVDIEYIHKIHLSEYTDNNFEIDVNLSCLEIPTETDEYQSYLTFLKGDELVEIYEKFGQKLFEQNVRTFLQFKGSVNKGIRNTIEYNPELFFAYNNGITATASKIEKNDDGKITKIVDFQVVNGAQTTSAIYAAKKNSKLDVSKVSVQMKLSVVKEKEKQNEFVSKVSEYANTQNKVNKSDFFSNNPYHKEMKNNSKRIWVASVGGSQRRTHWFYERVRGEYLNEQTYLSKTEKTKFQLENPKTQLLDKTFLSKSENSWLQKPDVVSKGAQYSFSYFADYITDWLEKDSLAVTEEYFKSAIARVILFKSVEKIISNADWYDGGFRAQTVTYVIAYLSHLIGNMDRFMNFNLIWEEQKLPDELTFILPIISKRVYDTITNPPAGSANISQWCKRIDCWNTIKSLEMDIKFDDRLLIDLEEKKSINKENKKEKKLDIGIEMQMFVFEISSNTWLSLLEYYKKNKGISTMQLEILEKISRDALRNPSEKHCKVLYQLYDKAKQEGFIA